MGGLRNYLALQLQARTGLSSGLFIWALLAVVFWTLTAGFILLIAFIWLAERYDPLTAAAALAGFFLLVTIIALTSCLWSRRRTIERAELALAARRNAAWLDPKLVRGVIQVSRTVGWRKLVPLLALGIFAAGVGMEWFGRDKTELESDEQDRELARAA
jgi:hypothetical protein